MLYYLHCGSLWGRLLVSERLHCKAEVVGVVVLDSVGEIGGIEIEDMSPSVVGNISEMVKFEYGFKIV